MSVALRDIANCAANHRYPSLLANSYSVHFVNVNLSAYNVMVHALLYLHDAADARWQFRQRT